MYNYSYILIKCGHSYGKIVFIFLDPSNGAVFPVYRNLVKMLTSHSHDNAEVKVVGSDKVRFSLFFEEDGEKKLYLLNTAYDTVSVVKVLYNGKTEKYVLEPMELKTVTL